MWGMHFMELRYPIVNAFGVELSTQFYVALKQYKQLLSFNTTYVIHEYVVDGYVLNIDFLQHD